MSDSAPLHFADRIVEQLIRLKRAGGLSLTPLEGVGGVSRFDFRAGGWPVTIDLDQTVLEVRAYHDRDTIGTSAVREDVMDFLTGDSSGSGTDGSVKECREALRAIVSEWRTKNARVHMRSPDVARHPDGWNHA